MNFPPAWFISWLVNTSHRRLARTIARVPVARDRIERESGQFRRDMKQAGSFYALVQTRFQEAARQDALENAARAGDRRK